MYDVIVVGLGPAGSVAARELSKKGLKVLGIDKERFPRDKSCGGYISTKIDGVLDFDFSETVDDLISGIIFNYKLRKPVEVMSERPFVYSVDRPKFDSFLLDKARAAGVEIIEGARVDEINDTGEYVEVSAAGSIYRAGFLVGADGAGGVVGRSCLDISYKNTIISLATEVDVSPEVHAELSGKCIIDFGTVPHGYGWIFPKKGYLSVGIAGKGKSPGDKINIKKYFNEFINGHELLKGSSHKEVKGWIVPVYDGEELSLTKGRVLVAGDAGFMVDPFIGEGIYYAIRGGQLAAEAIGRAVNHGAGKLKEYENMVREEFYSDFDVNKKLVDRLFNNMWLWYKLIHLKRDRMKRYYDVLRGEESASDFYEDLKRSAKNKVTQPLKAAGALFSTKSGSS
ncbi:MAG: NAD(P)/FAD-dependent oxidoreductase [Thermodesulfobacteriota bacterium]